VDAGAEPWPLDPKVFQAARLHGESATTLRGESLTRLLAMLDDGQIGAFERDGELVHVRVVPWMPDQDFTQEPDAYSLPS